MWQFSVLSVRATIRSVDLLSVLGLQHNVNNGVEADFRSYYEISLILQRLTLL